MREVSSMKEQLNLFSDDLQLSGSQHLNSLFADLCVVLLNSPASNIHLYDIT